MFTFDLQLFAHKKGVSSTRNGRDSHSKRLGVKEQAGTVVFWFVSAARISIRATMLVSVRMIPCSQRLPARLLSSAKAATSVRSAFIRLKKLCKTYNGYLRFSAQVFVYKERR